MKSKEFFVKPIFWAILVLSRLCGTQLQGFSQAPQRTLHSSFVRYSEMDGLPSNNVYFAMEDHENTIWFATDNGVSRFDGISFQNYKVENGLSDNEVFSMYEDSQNRIWLLTFSGIPSYYHNGRFHNPSNTKFLTSIAPGNFLSAFYEDENGNVYLGSKNGLLYKIDKKNHVSLFWKSPTQSIYSISQNKLGDFIVFNSINSFVILKDGVEQLFKCCDDEFSYPPRILTLKNSVMLVGNGRKLFSISPDYGESFHGFDSVASASSITNIQQCADENIWISTTNGVFLTDSCFKYWECFLDGKSVSSSLMDHEGGMWFSSKSGVFYSPNRFVFTNVSDVESEPCGATSLAFDSNAAIVIGYESGDISKINPDFGEEIQFLSLPRLNNQESRINHILSTRGHGLAVSSNLGSFTIRSGVLEKCTKLSVKKTIKIGDENDFCICHSLGWNILKMDDCEGWVDSVGQLKSYFDRNRCYDIASPSDTVLWVANSNGLSKYLIDSSMGTRRVADWSGDWRIDCIEVDSVGGLWVGTAGNGLVRLFGGDIQVVIPKGQGGGSCINAIRFWGNDKAFIATSMGILRVSNFSNSKRNIQYSWVGRGDGLPSEKVNDVLFDGVSLWAATPLGIVRIGEDLFDRALHPPVMRIDRLIVNSVSEDVVEELRVSYYDNSLSIGFVGISFSSLGMIDYRYRMLGLDSSWTYSARNFVEYPDLPYGEFEFQVQARTRRGAWSEQPAFIKIFVDAPFWRKPWFWILTPVLFLVVVIVFLVQRISEIKSKNVIEKRALEAEQRLLAVQMNPHFIFNALNSIQRYFFSGELEKSNEYLTDFGHLIRMILEHSRRSQIELSEEIAFIDKYLKMETLRLGKGVEYEISVHDEVLDQNIVLPPMLLQPFLENAIWHGLVNKQFGGFLHVRFSIEGNFLKCVVEDNGVGRKRAMELKSVDGNSHKSLALEITRDRIKLLNQGKNANISLQIEDLFSPENISLGTRVTLLVPLKIVHDL